MPRQSVPETFKSRLRAGDPLVATFVKTPSAAQTELLGQTALDAVIFDGEHASFDRTDLDVCLLAARAVGLPSVVRVPALRREHVLQALDLGAIAVMVPHVCSAEDARAAVLAAHYGPDGRGYSATTRAADYGARSMPDHLKSSASLTTVFAQIEDPDAVDSIEEIAATPGLDCLFIGLMDLTVSYGAAGPNDPEVESAVQKICKAAREQERPVGIFLDSPVAVPRWRKMGVSFFAIGSDHGCLRSGANAIVDGFANAVLD